MLFKKIILDSLRPLRWGSLEITLPDGEKKIFGGLHKGFLAKMHVRDEAFFKRAVLFGPIGFAESYMEGEWETPDLTKLIAWFVLNSEDAGALKTREGRNSPFLNLLNAYNRFLHRRRPNSVGKARQNIQEHYDLSNAFFALWLDPSMTYSSAYFDPPNLSLAQAQSKKYDVLCRKLRLNPSDHVLEIGTGWGGFSIHAARTYGCRITSVTISEEQYREATERIVAAGLAERVEVLLTDYRLVEGRFDKIVSIEMIEAVGDQYLDEYFSVIHQRLKPRGLAGLQMITCPDLQYPILRDGVDFIQKHIFPGSLLVSLRRVTEAINAGGNLNLFHWEDMGAHYAKTLRIWRENFESSLDAVREQGFDEVFIRKWRYYLAYCEAAFGTRHISVVQAIWSRPDNIAIKSPVYDILQADPLLKKGEV